MSLERHEKFCQEYVKCGDAETAAMLAGYSLTNLEGTADKLINLQGIRDRIKQLGGTLPDLPPIAKMSMRERRDKVFEQWWRVAFFDPRRLYDKDGQLIPIHKLPADVASVIQALKVDEIKFYDQLKALDSLARHMGMFSDIGKTEGENLQEVPRERLQEMLEQTANELGYKLVK